MVTSSNSTSTGAAFTKAPNDSLFGKVFLNNMDSNSFSSDTKKQISLTILNSQTALFRPDSGIVTEQEYKNCQVNRNSKVILCKNFMLLQNNLILDREGLA